MADFGADDPIVGGGAPAFGADDAVIGAGDKRLRVVGPGESALRGFVGGGGSLLNGLDVLGEAFNPAARIRRAITGEPSEVADLASSAKAYDELSPTEIPADLISRVLQGGARVVPELAGAIGSAGEIALPEALSAGARGVPLIGKALEGIVHGAPVAAALTGEQAANQPADMPLGDRLADTAKSGILNALMAGLPTALGSGPLLRTLTGAGIGAGASAGQSAIQGQPQDAASNIIGALLGGALGGVPHAGQPEFTIEDLLRGQANPAAAPPRAGTDLVVPRGAEPAPATPLLADRNAPVDAEFWQAATPAADPVVAPPLALPAPAPAIPELPAPVVTVDLAGNARTSASVNDELTQVAQQNADAAAAVQNRRDLGLTPDIETLLAKRQNAAVPEELTAQAHDDAPPWWLAGQDAEAQHDLASTLPSLADQSAAPPTPPVPAAPIPTELPNAPAIRPAALGDSLLAGSNLPVSAASARDAGGPLGDLHARVEPASIAAQPATDVARTVPRGNDSGVASGDAGTVEGRQSIPIAGGVKGDLAAAPIAPPSGFETAKGSQYVVHDDGTTTRNKAARDDVGHEGDVGAKERSARTVYVDSDPSSLSAAGLSNLGPKGARVAIKDGKATLVSWNDARKQWGAAPSARGIPVHDEPAVGRYPLELWKPATDVAGHEAYANMHAGNAITKLTEPENETAAPKTAAPPEREMAAKPVDDDRPDPPLDIRYGQRRLPAKVVPGAATEAPTQPPARGNIAERQAEQAPQELSPRPDIGNPATESNQDVATKPENAREDWTPTVHREGRAAIDGLTKKFGGSTLADAIDADFKEHDGAQLIGKTAKTTKDFAALAQVYRDPRFETMRYVFTDDAGRIVGETAISTRSPSTTAAFETGENEQSIIAAAKKAGGSRVYALHNHPSGDPTASKADIEFTKAFASAVRSAGLNFKGHVVLDHTTYTLIDDNGVAKSRALDVTGDDPLRGNVGFAGREAGSMSDFAKIGREIADQTPENSIAIITTDHGGRVTLATVVPDGAVSSKRAGGALLRATRMSRGARNTAITTAKTFDANRDTFEQAIKSGILTDVLVGNPDGSYTSGGARLGLDASTPKKIVADVFDRKDSGGVRVYEPPSRRPGESQAQYANRLLRKDKAQIAAALKIAKNDRAVVRGTFRGILAERERNLGAATAAFREARKMFDETPSDVNYASIDAYENGKPILDADARQFFDQTKAALDARTAEIAKLDPSGGLKTLIDNYFPHFYEDSARAGKLFQDFRSKRPLGGDKGFLKERKYPTLKEAMATGLKPISDNPVDFVMFKIAQMDKYIGMLKLAKDLADRKLIYPVNEEAPTPPGFNLIDDPGVQKALRAQMDSYPKQYAGHKLYVPEMIARDINNYLTPALDRFGAWRAFRQLENTMVALKLGWSAFHAGFTTIDNSVMHTDIALRQLANGHPLEFLKTLAGVVSAPYEGGRIAKNWRGELARGQKSIDPDTHAILMALEKGGARLGMSSTEFNDALPQLVKRWRQRGLGKGDNAIGGREVPGGQTIKDVGTLLKSIGEASSYLIHKKLVPAQKMSARVMLLKHELDRFSEALGKKHGDYAGTIDEMHPDTLTEIAGYVVDLVDFRLGQMAYDNRFWNKAVLQAAQTVLMAPGWQAGTLQTVFGGAKGLKNLTHPTEFRAPLDKAGTKKGTYDRFDLRLSNMITLALVVGVGGGLWQWLVNGIFPKGRDWFLPRTGEKNPDGSDTRLQPPSYWQDHYKLGNAAWALLGNADPSKLGEMVGHKMNPLFSELIDTLENKDYFGNQVFNPKDPAYKRAADVAKHVAEGFLPLSVSNNDKLADASPIRKAAAFVGFAPASAANSRSDFENFVTEHQHHGGDSKTEAQAEAYQARKDAEDALRAGKDADLSKLTPKEQRAVTKAARMQVPEKRFKALALDDKLDAWDIATPEEREKYHLRDIMARVNPTRSDVFNRKTPADKSVFLKRLQAIVPNDTYSGDDNG